VTAVVVIAWLEPTRTTIVGDRADALGKHLLALVAALTALAVAAARMSTREVGARRSRGSRAWAGAGAVLVVATVVLGAARFPGLAGDRPTFWRVAASEAAASPILGSGAGTYRQVWLERRPVETSVRDAHSIVVEALAELGPLGVVLVATLLALPLGWAARARARPLVPAIGGAFAAYGAHASVDWDWELPGVTLAGLSCAVALGVAADGDRNALRIPRRARGVALAIAVGAAIVASIGLVGATALEDASRALARDDAAAADRAADRAARWQPWSAEPLLVRGQARASLGDRVGARRLFARAAALDANDYRPWLGLAAVSDGAVASAAVLRARALNPRGVRVVPARAASPVDPTPRERGEEEAA
jgi:hypothetical protein